MNPDAPQAAEPEVYEVHDLTAGLSTKPATRLEEEIKWLYSWSSSPTTPDQYDAVDSALDPKGNPPDGLIAHTARFDGDTLRVLDIWESPEAFGAFAGVAPRADDRRDAR